MQKSFISIKNVALKQILHGMNDIFNAMKQLMTTFATDFNSQKY